VTNKFKENCSGCLPENNPCGVLLRFQDILTAYDVCPCSTCIVKVMCGRTCDAYDVFYRDMHYNWKRRKYNKQT
jgi:hypothetical protein